MNIPGRKYFRYEEVLTEWFPRGGDNMIFRAEQIEKQGSNLQAVITFQTKNYDDEGDGEVIFPPGTPQDPVNLKVSTDGVHQVIIRSFYSLAAVDGMRQLVRVRIVLEDIATGGGEKEDWILLRLFQPIFYDDAKRTPPRV